MKRIICIGVPASLLLAACDAGLPGEDQAAQIEEEAAMFEEQAESRVESLNKEGAPFDRSDQRQDDVPGTDTMHMAE